MLHKQITSFIIVGLINTLFGYSIFALFIFFNLHYSLAVFLATILGVLFNFKTIGKFVFNSQNNRLIFRFISVYFIIYILNIFGLWLLKSNGFENMYLNGLILLIPLAIISFSLNKNFVFKG